MDRSFSELSLTQRNSIKKKKKAVTTTTIELNKSTVQELSTVVLDDGDHQQETNREEEDDRPLSTNSVQNFKPQYLKVSDRIFKQMLLNAIQGGDTIVKCLDTNEKIQIVRRMTEVTNNLEYFDLQRHLWQDYYNLGIKENMWESTEVSNVDVQPSKQQRTFFFLNILLNSVKKRLHININVPIMNFKNIQCIYNKM